MGSFRRLARSDSGAAAIEFAIIVWVLILVCLAVIEFGRGLHVRNELSFAGDRAARMILMDPAVTNVELKGVVEAAFTGPRPQDLRVTSPVDQEDATFRTILIEYPFTLLIPGLGDAFDLSVSRRVPIG